MPKDQTTQEKRAAADAAKKKADDAKAASDAQPDNADLKKKADDAAQEAATFEQAAAAPSHDTRQERPKSEKIKKRMEILRSDLRSALIAEGKDPDEMSDEEILDEAQNHDDSDDDDAPVTKKTLRTLGIIKTVDSMIGQIANPELRQAVSDAVKLTSEKLPAQERFDAAMAIASSSKNTRIAQEAARTRQNRPQQYVSGGAPAAREDGDFTPTPQESAYMKKHGLTKDDIIRSRRDAEAMNFGRVEKD